jgi:hypothetical protein
MWRRGCLVSGVVLILFVSGCSAAHDAMNSPSAEQKVRATWAGFFDTSTPAAQREQLLQDGSAFAADLAAQAHSGAMAAAVTKVDFSDATHATVSFSLSVAPSTRLPSVAGAAVRVGGAWLVSRSTMCAVLAATGRSSSACS